MYLVIQWNQTVPASYCSFEEPQVPRESQGWRIYRCICSARVRISLSVHTLAAGNKRKRRHEESTYPERTARTKRDSACLNNVWDRISTMLLKGALVQVVSCILQSTHEGTSFVHSKNWCISLPSRRSSVYHQYKNRTLYFEIFNNIIERSVALPIIFLNPSMRIEEDIYSSSHAWMTIISVRH